MNVVEKLLICDAINILESTQQALRDGEACEKGFLVSCVQKDERGFCQITTGHL